MDRIEQYKELANKYDLSDELSHFKERFDNSNEFIYLVGNSLGKLPLDTINNINQTVKIDWGKDLVSSWNEKWLSIENIIAKKISKILKCDEKEVYVGDSTSENLYKLLKSILINNSDIKSIISDNLNFPSDNYIAEGVARDFKGVSFKLLDYGNEVEANIDMLKNIAAIVSATRKELTTEVPRISTSISTRASIEFASLLYDGFTLEEAASVVVYPQFDDAGGLDSERTFIKQLVQKYIPAQTDENLFNTDQEDLFTEEDIESAS